MNLDTPHVILDRILQTLHAGSQLRVWSVVITFFGDAIVPRGGTVSLAAIQQVMDRMDIEANAVRTAMSRLARDGWVGRTRAGRQSYYSLADEGVDLFEEASRRIYASAPSNWNGEFQLVLAKGENHRSRLSTKKKMREAGFGSPMSDIYVRPNRQKQKHAAVECELIALEASGLVQPSLQTFVAECWPLEQLAKNYQELIEHFMPAYTLLHSGENISPLDGVTLRLLLIHEWRKLVLRDVDLPTACKLNGESEEKARKLVAELYQLLLPTSELFLDETMAAPGKRLPPPEEGFGKRFA